MTCPIPVSYTHLLAAAGKEALSVFNQQQRKDPAGAASQALPDGILSLIHISGRNIPLPVCLAECLKAAKETSTSEYVVSNRDGEPLSYTQFKRLWQYIVTRTVKELSLIHIFVTAAIAGVFLFALYTVFQIPGYYKYGSIKGRVFMYIPVAGFLVTLLLLSKMPAIGNSIISVVESSPILLVLLAVFAIVVMYAVSIFLSIRVMKNKEM